MIVSLLGLYLYKLSNLSIINCEDNNTIISVFITIVSVFLGVILTFILVGVWNHYIQAEVDSDKEANTLLLLYQTISFIPNTEKIQELIIQYIEYIINVEYPALSQVNIPEEGNKLITELEDAIYSYVPVDIQQTFLYQQSMNLVNQASNLRIDRLTYGTIGVNSLIWWVMVLDFILVVVLSWFLTCTTISHYILTAIVTIYAASVIFIIIILAFPFRGYYALTPTAFETVLNEISE